MGKRVPIGEYPLLASLRAMGRLKNIRLAEGDRLASLQVVRPCLHALPGMPAVSDLYAGLPASRSCGPGLRLPNLPSLTCALPIHLASGRPLAGHPATHAHLPERTRPSLVGPRGGQAVRTRLPDVFVRS